MQGCDDAAQKIFGHAVETLTAAEAALLAGLPQSPSSYSPWRHPERALKRRDFVLHRMREAGALDDAQLATALAAPLGVLAAAEAPAKPPGAGSDDGDDSE